MNTADKIKVRVDVIIPIYNALEYLEKCLESVAKYTHQSDKVDPRIIMINDASTDPEIAALLERWKDASLVLHNPKNLGFPKTVNIGMSQSPSADVVLLNSDTEVSEGWLEGLVEEAYREDNVATVTPVSNGAYETLAWPANQQCPANGDANHVSLLLQKRPWREKIEIPQGDGFCLFIRRRALEQLGLFDENAFGLGYGEETEFCLRAARKGMVHLLAPNTFVKHKIGASMSVHPETPEKTKGENAFIVGTKYPEQKQRLQEFQNSQKFKALRDHWDKAAFIGLAQNKKRVLVVNHVALYSGQKEGGVVYHIEEIQEQMGEDYVCYVLSPVAENQYTLQLLFGNFISYQRNLTLGSREDIEDLLLQYGIDFIHIHHSKGMPNELVSIANYLKIPSVMTIHDYYQVCPNYTLIDPRGRYCELPAIGDSAHKECMSHYSKEENFDLAEWRKHSLSLLNLVSHIIFVSDDTLDRFLKIYPNLAQKASVIPCTVRETSQKNLLPRKRKPRTQPNEFSVCFLGKGTPEKGSSLIKDLAEKLAANQIHCHFLGAYHSQPGKILGNRHATYHGRYFPDQIQLKLKEMAPDIVCLFSPWPETYSRTLTESWLCGIPALVSHLGAPAERVRKTGAGWVVDKLQSDVVCQKILEIRADANDLREKTRLAANLKLPRNHQIFMEIDGIYRGLMLAESASIPIRASILSGFHKCDEGFQKDISRPEQILKFFPETVLGKYLGVASMVYLRSQKVGLRETLGRPLRKMGYWLRSLGPKRPLSQ